MSDGNSIDIKLQNGSGEFVTTSTTSTTVGELRSELGFGSNVIISVDGTTASDSRRLRNAEDNSGREMRVSAIATDKTGGESTK